MFFLTPRALIALQATIDLLLPPPGTLAPEVRRQLQPGSQMLLEWHKQMEGQEKLLIPSQGRTQMEEYVQNLLQIQRQPNTSAEILNSKLKPVYA
jgi:hypothetical protein